MENDKVGVTFILVKPDGKILMQLRDDGKGKKIRYPNMWCFPGGTKEKDETPEECAVREIEEEYELSLEKDKIDIIGEYDHDGMYDYVFLCVIEQNAKPVFNEGADMKWKTIEEIKRLKLAWEQDKILDIVEERVRGR